MDVKPDGLEQPAFALRCVATGRIELWSLSETAREVERLLEMKPRYLPDAGAMRVVPVVITVSEP